MVSDMYSEYLRGYFNSLLLFFAGYNLITGVFFVKDGIKAQNVSKTYEIIEMQFSIVGMGVVFILTALLAMIAYFRHGKHAMWLLVISSSVSFLIMLYYGYTLLTVEPLTVISYRYLYIGMVHGAMVVGGVVHWIKTSRLQKQNSTTH